MKFYPTKQDSKLYSKIQTTSTDEDFSNVELFKHIKDLHEFSAARRKRQCFCFVTLLLCILAVLSCIFVVLSRLFQFTGTEPFRIQGDESRLISTEYTTEDLSSQKNQINPWPGFCPYATCNNSYVCQPCQRRFVFLIAHGRSGSTSLLDALNMLPGLRISGENNGIVVALDEMFHRLTDPGMKMPDHVYEIGPEDLPRAWWHYWIPQGALACSAQKYVEILDPPQIVDFYNDENTIIGFKTVRFQHDHFDQPSNDFEMLKKRVDAIRSMFPCSRFIFNLRNDVRAASSSAWMKREGWKGAQKVKGLNNAWRRLAKYIGGDQATVMELEKWGKNPDFLNEVVDWLGFKGCKFPEGGIPHDNDSRKGNFGYNVDDKRPFLGKYCRYMDKYQ